MATQFLDFYDIFVNQLVGNVSLAMIIILFIVTLTLIRSRAPSQVFLLMMFVIGGILSYYMEMFLVFILIFGLGFAGWMLISKLRRE